MRYGKLIVSCVVILLVMECGRGERKYKFGTSADFITGGSNYADNSAFGFTQVQKGVIPFYSVYPSFRLDSEGQHSTMILSYDAPVEQFPSESELNSISHLFNFGYDGKIGKRARLRLTETFSTLPDFSTLSVIKGISMTPQGFRYVFEPSLAKSSNLNNSVVGRFDLDIATHSYLGFSISSNYRRYNADADLPMYFHEQIRTEGGIDYSHKVNPHRTFSLRYFAYQNYFMDHAAALTQRITLGYAEEITPSLFVSLEAGPSFIERSPLYSNTIGYFVSVNLMKTIRENRFSLNYTYRSGDSTGFGYLVDSRQGGIGFRRTLGRSASIGVEVSGFQQKQDLTGAFDYWGIQGSAGLSRTLGDHWVVTVGGSYSSYKGEVSTNDSLYKRFYVALGYRLPELWRTSK